MTTFNISSKEAHTTKWVRCWQILQYIGLKEANITVFLYKTILGGPASLQMDGKPYTGEVKLAINKNSICNYSIPKEINRLFKKFVGSAFQNNVSEFNEGFSGVIKLKYREGELKLAQLTTN